jgi:nitroreductase
MDLFEILEKRRSIRKYGKDSIPEMTLTKLLRAATQAPSAGNLQPWIFVVVKDARRRSALSEAALGQSMIEEAPVVVVVCADQHRARRHYGERGVELFCIQDTAAAIQNLLLAVSFLGLGACWVGSFNEEEVSRILGAPDGVRPIAIVSIGVPAEHPSPTPRRSLTEMIQEETF